jgi:hypothetical protein
MKQNLMSGDALDSAKRGFTSFNRCFSNDFFPFTLYTNKRTLPYRTYLHSCCCVKLTNADLMVKLVI